MVTSTLLLSYLAAATPLASGYTLTRMYDSTNIFEKFRWYTGPDPYTKGFTNYTSQEVAEKSGLMNYDNGKVYIGVDSVTKLNPNGNEGRKSVRLEGYETMDNGIIVVDFEHVPVSACGSWPAFWAFYDGEIISKYTGEYEMAEIDMYESVSYSNMNGITLWTDRPCKMKPVIANGTQLRTDCQHGCGISTAPGTFGNDVNAQGGIVIAQQIENGTLKTWQFERKNVPADLRSGLRTVNTATWGNPVLHLEADNCNVADSFRKMHLILNINFCGRYAESAWPGYNSGAYNNCKWITGYNECKGYVAENPQAFKETYFLLNSIKTFQK